MDLEGNELGPESGVALATAITRNNTLRYLNVRNNRFDARTGEKWLAGVTANLGLMEICFSVVEIGDDNRDAARDQLVGLFTILGDDHDLVRTSRPRLARALF